MNVHTYLRKIEFLRFSLQLLIIIILLNILMMMMRMALNVQIHDVLTNEKGASSPMAQGM